MDYFFLIKFNSKKPNSGKLMKNIKNLGCKVHFLSGDMMGNGILGIVDAPSVKMRTNFFKNVAYMVQKINNLPDDYEYPTSGDGDDSYDGMATWAYTTVGELSQGLAHNSSDDYEGLRPYTVETILYGGVTGVHGG